MISCSFVNFSFYMELYFIEF